MFQYHYLRSCDLSPNCKFKVVVHFVASNLWRRHCNTKRKEFTNIVTVVTGGVTQIVTNARHTASESLKMGHLSWPPYHLLPPANTPVSPGPSAGSRNNSLCSKSGKLIFPFFQPLAICCNTGSWITTEEAAAWQFLAPNLSSNWQLVKTEWCVSLQYQTSSVAYCNTAVTPLRKFDRCL